MKGCIRTSGGLAAGPSPVSGDVPFHSAQRVQPRIPIVAHDVTKRLVAEPALSGQGLGLHPRFGKEPANARD